MKRLERELGFTLLELVVTVAIFATVSLVVYDGLRQFLLNYERVSERQRQLGQLQTAHALLQNDIQNVLTKQIRPNDDELDDVNIKLSADGSYFQMVSAPTSFLNDISTPPNLVEYRVVEDRFIRSSYAVMDPTDSSPSGTLVLLDGIERMQIEAINSSKLDDPGGRRGDPIELLSISIFLSDNSSYTWLFDFSASIKGAQGI